MARCVAPSWPSHSGNRVRTPTTLGRCSTVDTFRAYPVHRPRDRAVSPVVAE